MWRSAANKVNKRFWIADKGWYTSVLSVNSSSYETFHRASDLDFLARHNMENICDLEHRESEVSIGRAH